MVTKNTDGETFRHLLARLAEAYGVQTRYRDATGRVRGPSQESLLKTLLALGAGVNGRGGPEGALREREAELRDRVIDPVVIAWEGVLPVLTLRLPGAQAGDPVRLMLVLEDGSSFEAGAVLGRGTAAGSALVRGWKPGRLPWGRHRLRVETAGAVGETWVIAAPRRCWDDAAEDRGDVASRGVGQRAAVDVTIDAALAALDGKRWGLFAPVYALRSRRDWGAGDLADLARLARWTGDAGGSIVATLPLLASSFGEDADPSPYRPVSRLFWNEFFLAPEDTVEWRLCEPARQELGADGMAPAA